MDAIDTFCQDFYNYQQHGIDFLISGSTHTVKKVVLHTNIVSDTFRATVHRLTFVLSREPHSSSDTSAVLGRFKVDQKTTKTVGSSPATVMSY